MACLRPFRLKNDPQLIPCGKCLNCVYNRMAGWSFRLQQELKQSSSAHFITLTYATSFVPITNQGRLGLRKRHLQLFFKRLRKAQQSTNRIKEYTRYNYNPQNFRSNNKRKPIKYYAVGEYGGRYHRPHYHIILFNADVELIQDAWKDPDTGKHIGKVHYGEVTELSIGYTLKYMSKFKKTYLSKNDDRIPEFALMSKKLGISYINKQTIKYHNSSVKHAAVVLEGGVKVALPRYFRDKIYSEEMKEKVRNYHQEQHMEKLLQTWSLSPLQFHKRHAAMVQAIKNADKRLHNMAMKGKTANF